MERRTTSDPLFVHILALALLTTLTNASALGAFGGGAATLPLAASTLMVAGLEWPVRRMSARRSAQDMDDGALATVQMWSCVLAAVIALTCGCLQAMRM